MPKQIAIDSDTLRSHASRVNQIGDDIDLASAAAGQVAIPGDAFGVMCSFMVPGSVAISMAGKSVIDSAAGLVHRAADQVRAWAADQDAADQKAAEHVTKIQADLGGLGLH